MEKLCYIPVFIIKIRIVFVFLQIITNLQLSWKKFREISAPRYKRSIATSPAPRFYTNDLGFETYQRDLFWLIQISLISWSRRAK